MTQAKKDRHRFLLVAAPLRLGAAWVFHGDGNEARGAPAWDFVNALLALGIVAFEG